MLSVLGCTQTRKLHLRWLLSPSPLYWAKDIFQAHIFRFFPTGFWFYPESHMRERGVSQSPDYAQECINSSKHLLPGLLIRPCLSLQLPVLPGQDSACLVERLYCKGGPRWHSPTSLDINRQVLANAGSPSCQGCPCLPRRLWTPRSISFQQEPWSKS